MLAPWFHNVCIILLTLLVCLYINILTNDTSGIKQPSLSKPCALIWEDIQSSAFGNTTGKSHLSESAKVQKRSSISITSVSLPQGLLNFSLMLCGGVWHKGTATRPYHILVTPPAHVFIVCLYNAPWSPHADLALGKAVWSEGLVFGLVR